MRPRDIDPFESYLEKGRVVEREKDPSQAESLLTRAGRKFENMERMGIDESTATDYFENLYEAVKMLIQSFMALEGYHPYSHEAIIAYGIENLELKGDEASRLNKFRRMRNDISYRGEVVTVKEAEEIRILFQKLLRRFEPKFREKK